MASYDRVALTNCGFCAPCARDLGTFTRMTEVPQQELENPLVQVRPRLSPVEPVLLPRLEQHCPEGARLPVPREGLDEQQGVLQVDVVVVRSVHQQERRAQVRRVLQG